MGMHDHEFEALIRATLQSSRPVTTQHKQRAWSAMQVKLAQQVMLPPLPQQRSLLDRLTCLIGLCGRWFFQEMLEEGRYRRAELSRYSLRQRGYGVHMAFYSGEFTRVFGLTTLYRLG